MSKFISIEPLFMAAQGVAPKYVVKRIDGESTYDSLSQVLDAFGFDREDEQEMDRISEAFGFRADDEGESASIVDEMPTQNVADWINAAIFAHDQTDGKENWGSIEHHGDPQHAEKWLKLYQEYIRKNYAPIARHAEQVADDAFVLVPDTHNKERVEVAQVCGISQDGGIVVTGLIRGEVRSVNLGDVVFAYDGRKLDNIEIIQTSESRWGYNLQHGRSVGDTVMGAGSGFRTPTDALYAAVNALALALRANTFSSQSAPEQMRP